MFEAKNSLIHAEISHSRMLADANYSYGNYSCSYIKSANLESQAKTLEREGLRYRPDQEPIVANTTPPPPLI